MTRTNRVLWSPTGPRDILVLLATWITAATVIAQQPGLPSATGIRAGGIEFVFATVEQGRAILEHEDLYVQQMSSFDRRVRMRSERDPGKHAFLQFAGDEVIEWTEPEMEAVRKAIESLDKPLREIELPGMGPVLLVHTTGREESGAAYTRGSAIFLPRGKTGSTEKPPRRLIAHELFHVFSRRNPETRDRLYAIIGFEATGQIKLPKTLAQRRITNPDAPEISHIIRLRLAGDQTAAVAPVLLAKSEFHPGQPSLFRYIEFKLMEVRQVDGEGWIPKLVDGEAVLHDPAIPDFHRQIGGNTGYIIHPEEIMAENFAALLTGVKVKDKWIIDAMRRVIAADQDKSD